VFLRKLSLPAKFNIAVALPIAVAFVVSGAAYIGIEKVSRDAEQAIESGRVLQNASKFSMVIERTGRLMREPGSQQEVEARLSPEIVQLRELAGRIVMSMQQRDRAMAEKLADDIHGLDQFVLATMLARGNITEARLLIPGALGSFAEAAMRLTAHLRGAGIDGAITKADQFSQAAGHLIEIVDTYAGSTDKAQFDPARRLVSNFSDLAVDATATLKAGGKETRNLSRDMERTRSKLFGLVTQLGSASERFESLTAHVAGILEHAQHSASVLQSDNQLRSNARLVRISAWTDTMAFGALIALCAGLFLAGGVPIFVRRSIIAPLSQLENVMLALVRGHTEADVRGTHRTDAIGAMARSVVVFRDNILEAERLRAEKAESEQRIAERRKADMHTLAGEFQTAVGSMIDTVSSASTELEAAAGSLSGIAETTQVLSASVASTFQQASTNVQTVAATTDQLSASINQIARQAQESSRIASDAVQQAHITDACIVRLSHAAERIGDVVRVISSIAGQTNMLALNAAIEAARAGDAGRGFSVVAQEVKTLAASTTRATEEIGEQISGMQAATRESVLAIEEISNTIGRIAEIASVTLSAVEEQSTATEDITRNVQQATEGTSQVAASITDVSRGAGATESASAAVLASAQSLSGESARLKREVERFLAMVRAA
jgi:methyl-accepting chemotaxis protein